MLYIPAGFPHTTDTLEEPSAEASIHLTIGDMGALFFYFFTPFFFTLEEP
jgi:hypothetical protein